MKITIKNDRILIILIITYDYLSEKYSIDEITNINNKIKDIIKQVCKDSNIYIEDINI